MKALLERLHELGYSEGKNMTFEYSSGEGRPERLPQLAQELVRARPDVLIAGFGTLAAQEHFEKQKRPFVVERNLEVVGDDRQLIG